MNFLTFQVAAGCYGPMRVAVAQISSWVDPSENLTLVAQQARKAAEGGADLVVFPEATMASFVTRSRDVAQPLDGPWANEVRRIAADLGTVIVVGMFTVDGSGEQRRPVNTLLVTGQGVEASYDKIHMYDAWGFIESQHIAPGHDPVTITIGGLTLGFATCYEVRFPEMFKYYAEHGAHAVILGASWAGGPSKTDQWRNLCRARALDSTCYVVAAGQADPTTVGREVKPGSPTGVGHSVVVDPLGRVLAEAGEAPDMLFVDLDADVVADARSQLPVLATSRFKILPPERA